MPAPILTLCLDAMRTRFELVLSGRCESHLRDAGEQALHEIEDVEACLSLFRPDSLLSHINRTAANEPVRLDAPTFDLLLTCQHVWQASGGAFDPTIAPRMTTLGLHTAAALPDTALTTGFQHVHLDPFTHTIGFLSPVALDLGAIAKGHALDLAGQSLRDAGITCALIHAGTSSVLAIGAPPDSPAWTIALRPPSDGGGGMVAALGSHSERVSPSLIEPMLAQSRKHATRATHPPHTIALRDNALGVSAHHGRRAEHDPHVTHILDPRTGRSAAPVHSLAAVVAPTAALADAWSTACLVAGHRPAAMPPDLLLTLL